MSRPARSRNPRADGLRRALLAKVHVAKKQLGLDDPEYRAVLARFEVESSAALDIRGLESLLAHFRDLGWNPAPSSVGAVREPPALTPAPVARDHRPQASPGREALLAKIEALLSEKGRAEGSYVPWDYALAILQRQCGVERLEWASPEQLAAVIAALARDARRKGRRTA